MAGSQIERAIHLIELLAQAPRGLNLQSLADEAQVPKSAAHRMLAELSRLGYVRQNAENARYLLTTRLVAMGFRHLAGSGADVVQPILDRLAQSSGELVRLGVICQQRLTWIAKAQGAGAGLRYDPDMGRDAPLFPTASGHAWLATLSDAQALALVEGQGPLAPEAMGPGAPKHNAQLLERLGLARQRGYAQVRDSSAIGTAAIACAVLHPQHGGAVGVLSIAGPGARLPDEKLEALAPALLAAASEISDVVLVSEWFG